MDRPMDLRDFIGLGPNDWLAGGRQVWLAIYQVFEIPPEALPSPRALNLRDARAVLFFGPISYIGQTSQGIQSDGSSGWAWKVDVGSPPKHRPAPTW